MIYEGVLTKMETENGSPIGYNLNFGSETININSLLDKVIQITFKKYQCLNCGSGKKIYRQGHCYDCFFEIPQTADWIIRPELSKAHLGIEDRDLEYEKKAQLQPHIVYLALSSNVKVGVTRKSQIPTRWIDQGASEAMPILEVPNRYLAGISEIKLKQHVADKTNWRKMLKNEIPDVDLYNEKNKLAEYIPDEVKSFFDETQSKILKLEYPVLEYPEKVKSLNLEKSPVFEKRLKGIKGQYLIFDEGIVFNVRNNEGKVVSFGVQN